MNKHIPKIQSYPYREDLTSMCMKTLRWGTEAIKIAILHKVKLQLQLTLFSDILVEKQKVAKPQHLHQNWNWKWNL